MVLPRSRAVVNDVLANDSTMVLEDGLAEDSSKDGYAEDSDQYGRRPKRAVRNIRVVVDDDSGQAWSRTWAKCGR